MGKRKVKEEPIYLTVRNKNGTFVLHELGLSLQIMLDISTISLKSVFPIHLPVEKVLLMSKEEKAKLACVDEKLEADLVQVFIRRIRSTLRRSVKDVAILPFSERRAKRKEIKMLIESLSKKHVEIQGSASAHYQGIIAEECQRLKELHAELQEVDQFFKTAAPWARVLLSYASPEVLIRIDETDDDDKEITAGGPYNIVREDRPDAVSVSQQNKIKIRLNEPLFRSAALCGFFATEQSLLEAGWLSAFALYHLTRHDVFTLHIVVASKYDGCANGHRWALQRGAVCCFYQTSPEQEYDFVYDE